MSLILPSSSAPRAPTNPAPNASARSDAPAEDAAGSFGEALSRSLEPAGELAGKGKDRAAPVKRQADKPKTDMQDLINAMAMGLVPLQSRIAKAVPSGDAAAGSASTGALTATTGAAITTDAAARANALAASATAALAGLPTSVAADGPTAAAVINTDTAQQTAMGSAANETSAAGTKTTVPSALIAVADSSALALTPGVMAGQNAAPESGLGGQSEKRDNRGAIELTGMRAVQDTSVDLKAVQAHGAAKIPADLPVPSGESSAIRVASSQAPDVATASTDAALPGAAMLAPLPGAAAPGSPPEIATTSSASLAPDVGSSEWGKALGQQVVHMGKAGQQVAELQLNPPGLGPLKVTLSMNDQQMQASFVSAHASVRVAIEAALPQLRSTLADSGISLGDTSVSSGSQQQQAFTDSPGEQASQRSYRTGSAPDAPALAARLAAAPLPNRRGSGGISVDTYA